MMMMMMMMTRIEFLFSATYPKSSWRFTKLKILKNCNLSDDNKKISIKTSLKMSKKAPVHFPFFLRDL